MVFLDLNHELNSLLLKVAVSDVNGVNHIATHLHDSYIFGSVYFLSLGFALGELRDLGRNAVQLGGVGHEEGVVDECHVGIGIIFNEVLN